MNTIDAADKKYKEHIGVKLTSSWETLDKELIQLYGALIGDDQPIHTDENYAKATPFGGIISHGFLIVSLLPKFSYEIIKPFAGQIFATNVGVENLKFRQAVKADQKIRAHFTLKSYKKLGNKFRTVIDIVIEIEGESKPAMTCDWINLHVFA